jgi:hypothetical protein
VSDGTGRTISTLLVPILAARPDLSLDEITTIVRALTRDRVALWQDEVRRTHERYWQQRLTREHHIAAYLATTRAVLGQPGLFDRRIDRRPVNTNDDRTASEGSGRGDGALLRCFQQVNTTELRPILILETTR